MVIPNPTSELVVRTKEIFLETIHCGNCDRRIRMGQKMFSEDSKWYHAITGDCEKRSSALASVVPVPVVSPLVFASLVSTTAEVHSADCTEFLRTWNGKPDCTFLDPPFNVGKKYASHDDDMPPAEYWAWMTDICRRVYEKTTLGGALYFMQREKFTRQVLQVLEDAGWTFQNLIIWRKRSSAVPQRYRYGKHYQILAFVTKGPRPRVFNKLRIQPPLLVTEKYERPTGMFCTDVWDDIRELTSGYYAGAEPLREADGSRSHEQQSPIALLLRIILSSTQPGDLVLDPFCGTGTTQVVTEQTGRRSVGIEKDPGNAELIRQRLLKIRTADSLECYRKDYLYTEGLKAVWPSELLSSQQQTSLSLSKTSPTPQESEVSGLPPLSGSLRSKAQLYPQAAQQLERLDTPHA
jgi:DNA modification methylase